MTLSTSLDSLQLNFVRHWFPHQQYRSQMLSVLAITPHHILICGLLCNKQVQDQEGDTISNHHRGEGKTSEIVHTPLQKSPFCKRRFNLSGIVAGTCKSTQKGSLAIKPDRIRGGRANEYPVCSTRCRSASDKRKCIMSFPLPSVRTFPYLLMLHSSPISTDLNHAFM